MSEKQVDVRALAELARMEVSDGELRALETELPAILSFVETIQTVDTSAIERNPALRNVMRDDADPHESGMYTDKLLAEAPAVRNGQFVVKQVVSRKKK